VGDNAWILVRFSCIFFLKKNTPHADFPHRNREDPIGYKLSLVQFDGKGSPVAPANSTTAATDILSNPDLSACPSSCFRPVGLAWDAQGRLFMSSDATGEIYVITKEDGSGVADVSEVTTAGETQSPTVSESAPSPSKTSSGAAIRYSMKSGLYWVVGVALVGAL